jgi:lipid-A-disaccharide synthase-like uncharacterized protein
MDSEQLLINLGVSVGFFVFMGLWLVIAMWMRVDANKRGMIGWVWIWIGLVGGPVALFIYLIARGKRPVLSVVHERDALLEEAARTHLPSNFDPDQVVTDAPVISPASEATPEEAQAPKPTLSKEAQAALEAEERRFRSY